MKSFIIGVPSNTLLIFENLFKESSLMEISKLRSFGIEPEFSFVGQGVFDDSAFLKASLLASKFKLKTFFKKQKQSKKPSMLHLRMLTFDGFEEADFFMLCDDDLEFRVGASGAYARCVEYLEEKPSCGAVASAGPFGGHPFGERIIPFRGSFFQTGLGIVIKNIGIENIFPKDSSDVLGGYEETVIAAFLNSKGFYVAKQFNNPSRRKNVKQHLVCFSSTSPIHNLEVIEKNACVKIGNLLGIKNNCVFRKPVLNKKFNFKPDAVASEIIKKTWKRGDNRPRHKCECNGKTFSSFSEALKSIKEVNAIEWKKLRADFAKNGFVTINQITITKERN